MYWRQFYHVNFRSDHLFGSFHHRHPVCHVCDAACPGAGCAPAMDLLDSGVKGADALLQATVTATLSFLVFTFGSLLVALQVASGQLAH
jgi:hypothetical protein